VGHIGDVFIRAGAYGVLWQQPYAHYAARNITSEVSTLRSIVTVTMLTKCW